MSIVLSKAGTKFIHNEKNDNCYDKYCVTPKLPVWRYDRCYSFYDWKELNKDDISRMVDQIIEHISYLNDNLENEEILFKESEIRNNLEIHLYNTSLNVKRKFKKLN